MKEKEAAANCIREGCIDGKIKRTASYNKEDALPGKVYGEIKSICNLCKREPEQILND